jgi:hypothetical protein
MLKFIKIGCVAFTLALTGCGTTSVAQHNELASMTRSTGQFKFVAEGTIIETRVVTKESAAASTTSVKDSIGLGTKSNALQGVTLALSALELLEGDTKVLEIKYKDHKTGDEMTTYSQAIPRKMDKFQPGRLFRYFETQSSMSFLRSYDTEADFNKFNQ